LKYFLLACILCLVVFFPILAFSQTETGSLEIILKYTSGDRVLPFDVVVNVYQDKNEEPFYVLDEVNSNPFILDSLPLGHHYDVEVFINGVFAGQTFLDLEQVEEKREIGIPLLGGLRFTVFYNDGATPIENAKVSIKSQDGKERRQGTTDIEGKTIRFWMQPATKLWILPDTVHYDYYIAEFSIGPNITYEYFPVTLFPGIAQDTKIVTPWPKLIDQLVTVSVYNDSSQKVSSSDGDFIVELYDNKNNRVAQSSVNYRGEAFFSNFKVSQYFLKVIKISDTPSEESEVWASKSVAITGENNSILIFENESLSGIGNNCNCVAFRMDDVQDYFLNAPVMNVIKLFQQKNAPLTIGVIGGAFGLDSTLVNLIKDDLTSDVSIIEVANHSWNNSPLTAFDKDKQSSFLSKTNEKILEILGVTPSVLVPPENLFNDDTLSVLRELNFTHISSHVDLDFPPYPLVNSTLYHFPAVTHTAKLNPDSSLWVTTTYSEIQTGIQDGLTNHGFALVMMHPYEFAVVNDGIYVNEPSKQQIDQIATLIDEIRNAGIKIVPISQINLDAIVEKQKPIIEFEVEPAKEIEEFDVSQKEIPSCNCVAFRLDNVQDFWLNDVQIAVIDVFVQYDAGVTIGIVGNSFGDDTKLVSNIEKALAGNSKLIEIANNGWNVEDFTILTMEEQSTLIRQANDNITNVLGVTPTVFIPPFENFDAATILALGDNNISHISSSIVKDPPPYSLSDSETYHFPRGPTTGKYVPGIGLFEVVQYQETLADIQETIDSHGFAVVTTHPQEFSVIQNGIHINQVDQTQLRELGELIKKIRALGFEIVPIGKINDVASGISIPSWIKNNAGWWANGQIEDSDFIQGIEYLIQQEIMRIPPTQESDVATTSQVPQWVKNNAGWWAEDQISDKEFVNGIEFLIKQGIIVV